MLLYLSVSLQFPIDYMKEHLNFQYYSIILACLALERHKIFLVVRVPVISVVVFKDLPTNLRGKPASKIICITVFRGIEAPQI